MELYKDRSKFLSLILRHKPETIGLKLDQNGWVEVEELLFAISRSGHKKMNMEMLRRIVAENNKKRFSFNEDETKIRANQGHSLPVDVELEAQMPPEFLYHGTADRFCSGIRRNGLVKQNRNHVHLSKDKETALNVGTRHGRPVILAILSGEMYKNGFSFYLSVNGVWLTDHVPVNYIKFQEEDLL